MGGRGCLRFGHFDGPLLLLLLFFFKRIFMPPTPVVSVLKGTPRCPESARACVCACRQNSAAGVNRLGHHTSGNECGRVHTHITPNFFVHTDDTCTHNNACVVGLTNERVVLTSKHSFRTMIFCLCFTFVLSVRVCDAVRGNYVWRNGVMFCKAGLCSHSDANIRFCTGIVIIQQSRGFSTPLWCAKKTTGPGLIRKI